jgi:glucokinase
MRVIAVGIGASSVKAAILDAHTRDVANRLPMVEIHARTFSELRSVVEQIVTDAMALDPVLQRIGISTTGSVSQDDVVMSSGLYSGYQNVNWLEILRTSSGGRIQVARVLNDGQAAAYGSFLADTRAKGQHVVHFVVGTGIGGGMVSDGVLFNGSHNFAGAYGHIKVEPEAAARCACGGRGCVELFAAAPAVARFASERGVALAEAGGRGVRELGSLARAGAQPAQDAFRTAGRWLGVAVACVANVADPAIVTIGGGVAAAAQDGAGGNWYVEAAAIAARGMVIPRIAEHLTVVEASLLNDAALIGAAARAAEL